MATLRLLETGNVASAEGVAHIVGSTDLVDLRVDEIHAGPLVTFGDDLSFRLGRGVPQFAATEPNHLMVRLEHSLEVRNDQGDPDTLTALNVAHVLTFEVRNDLEVENADVSAWIQTNVYFIVYPYVRQVFTTLTSAMGIPPVVLGYMRREDWPEFADSADDSADNPSQTSGTEY